MKDRAPFPVRDREASAMPEPDEHVLFVLLDMERAVQEGRLDDAWQNVGSLAVAAANAGRPLNGDEFRVINRVVTSAVVASRGAW